MKFFRGKKRHLIASASLLALLASAAFAEQPRATSNALELAQATQAAPPQSAPEETILQDAEAETEAAPAEEATTEIVVTGSYIRRKTQLNQPSPIATISAEDLAAIGANQISDLTFTLNIAQGSQNNADAFTQNTTTGTENINLRGLGVQSTLVLLNGKRQVNVATQTDNGLSFVDTASLVPFIAIERTEILKDGAAALYGTDAVAGVANFVTRKKFEGFEVGGEFRTANFDAGDFQIGAIFGHQGEHTKLVTSFAYLDRTALTTRERDFRGEFANAPFFQQQSFLTSFPPNIIIPTANATFAANNPALFSQFNAAYNQNVALFNFGVTGPLGNTINLPIPAAQRVLPAIRTADVLGQLPPILQSFLAPRLPAFLVGTFAGFSPVAATGGTDPLGAADGFTDRVIPVAQGVQFPGFNVSQLTPAQQAQYQAALAAVANAQTTAFNGGNSAFGIPLAPDPACAAAARQSDLISLLPASELANGNDIPPLGACSYDFGPTFSIIPRTTRIQLFTQVEHDFNDHLSFYGEFGYARNRNVRGNSNFPVTSALPISANSPFNPFGQPVFLATRSPGTQQVTDFFTETPNNAEIGSDTFRVVAGLKGDIAAGWTFDVSYTRAANDYFFRGLSDGLATQTLLATQGFGGNNCAPLVNTPGVGPCFFYNPFGSGATADPAARVPVTNANGTPLIGPDGRQVTVPVRNSQEVIDFVTGEISANSSTDLTVVDAVITGDVLSLPAGNIGLAAGFQYRDDHLQRNSDENTNAGNFLFVTEPTPDFTANRDVFALFGEIAIPVTKDFDISAAIRYENYGGTVGSTVDPKVAVIYRARNWLSFRGSWGTSFRAPSLFQAFGNQTSLNAVFDPNPATRGGAFVAIRTLGNENLANENSRAFNVGFTAEPFSRLVKFNVDYWNFRFTNIISEFDTDSLVALTLAGQPTPTGTSVTRDPLTGTVASVTTAYVNQGFINTSGLDISGNVRFPTKKYGGFSLGFDITYTLQYDIPNLQGQRSSALDSRNSQNFADPVNDFRGNINFGWKLGGHSVLGFVRYASPYTDDAVCSDFRSADTITGACLPGATLRRIGSHTTLDLQYNYVLKSGLFGSKQTAFSIGAINLTNNAPPFVLTSGGYDPRSADPRGRLIYFRMKASF